MPQFQFGRKNVAKPILHKTHYRQISGRQRVMWMPQERSENGVLIVRHPTENKEFNLRVEDAFTTPKMWFQFRQPAEIRTWQLLEGFPTSINIKGRPGDLTDEQLNTLLHTKVIQEFLLAEILTQTVARLQKDLDLVKMIVIGNLLLGLAIGLFVYQISVRVGV